MFHLSRSFPSVRTITNNGIQWGSRNASVVSFIQVSAGLNIHVCMFHCIELARGIFLSYSYRIYIWTMFREISKGVLQLLLMLQKHERAITFILMSLLFCLNGFVYGYLGYLFR